MLILSEKEYIFQNNSLFECCHASTVTALQNGTILAAWFGGSREGADDVAIWFSARSGGIWQTPVKIADEEGLPCWNPVLFREHDHSIYLFFKRGKTIRNWQTMVMKSADSGKTWSVPEQLVPGDFGGRGPVKNKPIILKDGSWLAPASTEGRHWTAFVDISRDRGKSWVKSRPVPGAGEVHSQKPDAEYRIPVTEESFQGSGFIQPTLWESEDGHVHMLLRSTEDKIYRSDSIDGGETWSPACATELPGNNSGLDITRSGNHLLVLAYNPVEKNWGPRTPLVLDISKDNGSTWTREHVLENENDEFSYPAIITFGNDIFITYTWKRRRIAFSRLTIIDQ